MLNAHKCLSCGENLVGRQDKKFCSDQCRATFNNRNKQVHERGIQQLNAQMRRNRTILKTLCPTGKATVRREALEEMGFSFRTFTSLYGTFPKTYFLCYDFGYMPLVEESLSDKQLVQKVLIVQQQDYMKVFDPWKYCLTLKE